MSQISRDQREQQLIELSYSEDGACLISRLVDRYYPTLWDGPNPPDPIHVRKEIEMILDKEYPPRSN